MTWISNFVWIQAPRVSPSAITGSCSSPGAGRPRWPGRRRWRCWTGSGSGSWWRSRGTRWGSSAKATATWTRYWEIVWCRENMLIVFKVEVKLCPALAEEGKKHEPEDWWQKIGIGFPSLEWNGWQEEGDLSVWLPTLKCIPPMMPRFIPPIPICTNTHWECRHKLPLKWH